ncbi:hypothetical protein AB835_00615 [Candidatus Endobugula sertula]|uniref:Uncharacterized protein n=1 Tax=Candidatus Endobugula sertula TaxID=62101 RepID=A0A1D2QTX1_9GAMM|nr:hypothetical protein AB835_00615 [Candidatus Endobugula sertula]
MNSLLTFLAQRLQDEVGVVAHLVSVDGVEKITGGGSYDDSTDIPLYAQKYEISLEAGRYCLLLPVADGFFEKGCLTEADVIDQIRHHFSQHYPEVSIIQESPIRSLGRYIPEEIPVEFWHMINEVEGDSEQLGIYLQHMDENSMIRFAWNYEEAAVQLRPFFYEMSDYSEDSIYELCHWIVAQGPGLYRAVWNDIDALMQDANSPVSSSKLDPGLLSECMIIYKERFKKDLPYKNTEEFYA